jgi:uncharacterized protein (DUF983 family)
MMWKEQDMKNCPYCAEDDLKDAAVICKHCGHDVSLSRREYRLALAALVLVGAVLAIGVIGVGQIAYQWANGDAKIVEER